MSPDRLHEEWYRHVYQQCVGVPSPCSLDNKLCSQFFVLFCQYDGENGIKIHLFCISFIVSKVAHLLIYIGDLCISFFTIPFFYWIVLLISKSYSYIKRFNTFVSDTVTNILPSFSFAFAYERLCHAEFLLSFLCSHFSNLFFREVRKTLVRKL